MDCPVCKAELNSKPGVSRKRKKPFILYECPNDKRHFIGFCHNSSVDGYTALDQNMTKLLADLEANRAQWDALMSILTDAEKKSLAQRLSGQ